jgi:hypothetical protein
MRVRYQGGYLRFGQWKKGPDRWEFLWWDFEANGTRVRRKAVIGTVQEYPNLGRRMSRRPERISSLDDAVCAGARRRIN